MYLELLQDTEVETHVDPKNSTSLLTIYTITSLILWGQQK